MGFLNRGLLKKEKKGVPCTVERKKDDGGWVWGKQKKESSLTGKRKGKAFPLWGGGWAHARVKGSTSIGGGGKKKKRKKKGGGKDLFLGKKITPETVGGAGRCFAEKGGGVAPEKEGGLAA